MLLSSHQPEVRTRKYQHVLFFLHEGLSVNYSTRWSPKSRPNSRQTVWYCAIVVLSVISDRILLKRSINLDNRRTPLLQFQAVRRSFTVLTSTLRIQYLVGWKERPTHIRVYAQGYATPSTSYHIPTHTPAKGLKEGLSAPELKLWGCPSLSSDTGMFHSAWKCADLSLIRCARPLQILIST
jgi:hypothetical protein